MYGGDVWDGLEDDGLPRLALTKLSFPKTKMLNGKIESPELFWSRLYKGGFVFVFASAGEREVSLPAPFGIYF
jgi:hypothetical protein